MKIHLRNQDSTPIILDLVPILVCFLIGILGIIGGTAYGMYHYEHQHQIGEYHE